MPASRHLATLAIASALTAAGPARAQPCSPGDLTGNGVIDFSDYLEFLTRFDAQDPSVDFNADGVVDFADYLRSGLRGAG